MKAVVMAGGKGTRLTSITNDEIPKPMVPVCGIPILEHQVRLLSRYGIKHIVFVVGYLHEKIQQHFGDGGSFGVHIQYLIEDCPLGTAGALRLLKENLREDFLLLFGDLILDFSIPAMLSAHKETGALATLFAHPNSHPYDSDLIVADSHNRITAIHSKNEPRTGQHRNLVNAGVYLLSPQILSFLPFNNKIDMEKDLLFPLINKGEPVFAYISPEYVKDAGTPERLKSTETDMKNGVIAAKNLDNAQKCIFLDRDGTLNKYNGLIHLQEQLSLEDTAVEAVKTINSSEYLAIVITNQPVVARGMCSEDDVRAIHEKLETLLGKQGAYLDAIFYCPHHPDKGYEGENAAYKINCNCRKPGVGLINWCIEKYNIDTTRSYIIGDTTVDIQTGINAGLGTALIKTGLGGSDSKYKATPDFVCDNILEAVQTILNQKENLQ